MLYVLGPIHRGYRATSSYSTLNKYQRKKFIVCLLRLVVNLQHITSKHTDFLHCLKMGFMTFQKLLISASGKGCLPEEESSSFQSIMNVYGVVCSILRQWKKSSYLLVMCCKLLHCQEIVW
jgi:hypothetical protein